MFGGVLGSLALGRRIAAENGLQFFAFDEKLHLLREFVRYFHAVILCRYSPAGSTGDSIRRPADKCSTLRVGMPLIYHPNISPIGYEFYSLTASEIKIVEGAVA